MACTTFQSKSHSENGSIVWGLVRSNISTGLYRSQQTFFNLSPSTILHKKVLVSFHMKKPELRNKWNV